MTIEAQQLAWEQCSRVYLILLAFSISIVLLAHFGFLLVALWRGMKGACLRATHLRTRRAEDSEGIPTRDGTGELLTFSPHSAWHMKSGRQEVRGLTPEEFLYFERFADFVYGQSHENL